MSSRGERKALAVKSRLRDCIMGLGGICLAVLVGLAPVHASFQSLQASVRVPSTRAPLVEIPFKMVDDNIILPGSINGSPGYDMILDTGMPFKGAMLLDREAAKEIGLHYSTTMELGGGGGAVPREADVATGVTLSFSGFRFPGQQVFVPRQTGFADDWPAPVVLGSTFFDHTVEIDFSRSLIRLYETTGDLPNDPGTRLDLTFILGIPVLHGRIAVDGVDPVAVTLITDTGVNAPLLVFPYSNPALGVPDDAVATKSGVLSEGLTGDVEGKIGRVAVLEIGPFVFTQVVAAFPTRTSMGHADVLGQNGFVGTGILKRFTVVFDYANAHLYLRPNDAYGEPFEWNMAGLLMGINRAGFLQVKDVVDGSPGAVEGIHAGDVITAVNGRDVRDLDDASIQSLFNEEGARLHLEVQRGSGRTAVTLTLRRIV
jgi:hypothetical protein